MMFELKPVTKHIIWGGERLSRDYGMGENGEKIAEAWELTCRGDGDNEIISGVDYVVKYRQNDTSAHKASSIIQIASNGTFKILRK